jgi:hypothetical protein
VISSGSSFLFSLFGVLMPKEEKNLSIYLCRLSLLFGLGLQDYNYVWVGRVNMVFKTFVVCACKNTYYGLWLVWILFYLSCELFWCAWIFSYAM